MNVIKAVLIENLERPHRVYRRFLEKIESVELVASFFYPEEFFAWLEGRSATDVPGVVIMDIRMDDNLNDECHHIDGIEAARQLRLAFPKIPLILYSMWDSVDYYKRVEEARFGTRYAFVKRYSLDDWDRFGEIIRRTVRGETYIDPEIRIEMDLLKQHSLNSPLALLENDDQRKVLALLADGLTNDEIAHTLARKTRWVEEIVKEIYELLWLSNEGSGDARRIRAAKIFQTGRVLRWERISEGAVEIQAQSRSGEWRQLEEVEREEREAKDDARVINNAVP